MNQSISPTKYVFERLKKDKLRLASAIFWSILFVIIPMQVPILTGALIDNMRDVKHVQIFGFIKLEQSHHQILDYIVIGLIIIAVSYGISAYFRTSSVAKVSRHFVADLRKDLIEKLEILSLDIHSKYGSGELLSRTMLDTQTLRPFVESSVIKTSVNVVRMSYPVVMLFILNPFLALLATSVLPVHWLIARKLQKKLHESSRQAAKSQSRLNATMKENLDGIETIQTSNAEKHSIKKIFEQAEKVESDQVQTQKYSGMISGFVWGLTGLGLALIWWQGGLAVLAEKMTIGTLIAFTGLALFAYEPLRNFTQVINAYQKGVVSAERIQEILDTSSSIQDLSANPIKIHKGRIEFRNVYFSYPSIPYNQREQVLNNINLSIEPNMLTAIVGKNGSGKSSLLKLIARLYDPTEGQVLIDDQDIKKVQLESLRSQIAVVPQTPVIFSGTVFENILIGKPDATVEEMEKACRSSDVLKFSVNLDKGLNTILGAGGVNLSGGEAQRIAIARALIRKPKILLLDEPSSSLDLESEASIMETLNHLKKDMTIILVGHHLQAISNADRVIVIDAGKLVEDGTHIELLQSQGIYSMLYLKEV
jgi:ABC-type multidrug transport system fused ATPase/permease subunit